MPRRALALIVTVALAVATGVPAAAFSTPEAGHACCTRLATAGCEHPTISCCPAPLAPAGDAQVPQGSPSISTVSPLVVIASGPWAAAGLPNPSPPAAAISFQLPPPDPSDPLYLRHSVLLV